MKAVAFIGLNEGYSLIRLTEHVIVVFHHGRSTIGVIAKKVIKRGHSLSPTVVVTGGVSEVQGLATLRLESTKCSGVVWKQTVAHRLMQFVVVDWLCASALGAVKVHR